MDTWDSIDGRRWVQAIEEGYVWIRTEGRPFAQRLAEADLAREIDLDTRRLESRQRQVARARQEAEAETARKSLPRAVEAFLTTFPTARAAGRAEAALARLQGFSGVVQRRFEFVNDAVAAGARVAGSEGRRKLQWPSGNYYTEQDITKTAMDLIGAARHIES